MNETLGLILVAVAGAGLSLCILLLFRRAYRAMSSRDPEATDSPGAWTEALAAQIPTGSEDRDQLRREVWAAGDYRPSATTELLAVRTLLAIAPLIAAGLIALLVEPPYVLGVAIGGLLGALLGYSLPRVWLTVKARSRRRRIARGLPVAVDVLTLCLSAGESLPDSLRHTADELTNAYPDVSDELKIVSRHLHLHSTEYALTQWAERCPVGEVKTLTLLLIQSDRLGTDTLQTLQEFNTNTRTQLRQRAEERANRASFWMLFPTIFCLWLAAAIVLVGPPYLEFWTYREEQVGRLMQDLQQNIERANPTGAPELPAQP